MKNFLYYDLRKNKYSDNIDLIFPDWEQGKERIAFIGAHDDDVLIGAGYAMTAALERGAEVYLVIFCNGEAGYSYPEQKDDIVNVRRVETENAYTFLGVKKENIIRFDYPDFSLVQFIGNKLQNGDSGIFLKVVDFIRNNGITRVFFPNGHREHTDHTAAYTISMFDIIQAGDPVCADRGKLQKVKSYLQYSIWADFSLEDVFLSGEEDPSIRANRAVSCNKSIEERIQSAIGKYVSQSQIIHTVVETRSKRLTSRGYVELYIDMDPRPMLDFAPYIKRIEKIINSGKED
jgi:LmbE family N-acetylglucosaminyl deacetylase